MNAKKQKAIDYARNLYCEVNEGGQKIHTLQSTNWHRNWDAGVGYRVLICDFVFPRK